jgi:hypothetical protein
MIMKTLQSILLLLCHVFQLRRCNQKSKEDSATWKDLLSAAIIKPISISLMLFTLQVLSGIDPVLFYTVDIFQAAGSTIDDYYSTIYVGIVQVVSFQNVQP